MALIQCPECSGKVSDTAFKCPKCAYQIRKPSRTSFGKIIKWIFILFNLFMAWSLLSGLGAVSHMEPATSEAGRTGAAIGTGLGVMFILSLWVFGDVILGLVVLFTRPKK